MQLSNLFQTCLYFTILLMAFTLCINFATGLGVFGEITPTWGHNIGNTTNTTIQNFTKSEKYNQGIDMNTIWGLVIGGGIIGAVAVAWLLQDATFVGIYIFSFVFWASFINCWGILFAVGLPASILTLFSVPIIFIFIGAIVGMLSGV